MTGDPEPPFDPRWLDLLAESCLKVARTSPRLEDLYLEQRFDLRVLTVHGCHQVEECHSEGSAARWRFPARTLVQALTGVSTAALEELLSRFAGPCRLPQVRPVPPAELDAPRGWREWAHELVDRLGRVTASARFIARHAVVVGPGSWSVIVSPPLVRIRVEGDHESALLAVWRHPQLGDWLSELATTRPARAWAPESGQRLPVLFTAGTGGALIHELLGHTLEADLAGSGTSPLARLGGAVMTAASVNLLDDPTRFDLPGAFSCDDEGIPAEPLSLVRDGVLVGWLCDRAGAERLGGSPGRGRRATWKHPPAPRLSNLVLAAGETAAESLQNDLRHGIVVTRVGGATVDPISARAVIQVERGWEVAHGRRRRPLAPCALTGGVLEILAHLDPHLGADPTPDWRLGWCVKGGFPLPTGSSAPSLLVTRFEVL